jgi:phosphatidylserine synthase
MAIVLDDREQSKRETGTSLMFIGLALWVAGALVVFFLPASVRLGSQRTFVTVILALAAVGLALMTSGYLMRGKPEE